MEVKESGAYPPICSPDVLGPSCTRSAMCYLWRTVHSVAVSGWFDTLARRLDALPEGVSTERKPGPKGRGALGGARNSLVSSYQASGDPPPGCARVAYGWLRGSRISRHRPDRPCSMAGVVVLCPNHTGFPRVRYRVTTGYNTRTGHAGGPSRRI